MSQDQIPTNKLHYFEPADIFKQRGRAGRTYSHAAEGRINDLLSVSHRFKDAFVQHRWIVGHDVEVDVDDVVWFTTKDEPIPFTRITLTFKDATAAMMFKLSHDSTRDQ